MNNCSNHKKDLFGQDDMKHLANDIGSLHYQTLYQLIYWLSKKIDEDAERDYKAGREKLAASLQYAGMSLFESALRMEKVWQVVQPFMPSKEPEAQASVATGDAISTSPDNKKIIQAIQCEEIKDLKIVGEQHERFKETLPNHR